MNLNQLNVELVRTGQRENRMTGKKYAELRAKDNADIKLKEETKIYDAQVFTLQKLINDFTYSSDLFQLVAAMKIGASILEENEFPMKEWAQYKYKFKRYGKEKRLNK